MDVRELPQITTFDVPPTNWNPAAASDQELMRYGFPRWPADPRQRDRYEQHHHRPRDDRGSQIAQRNIGTRGGIAAASSRVGKALRSSIVA